MQTIDVLEKLTRFEEKFGSPCALKVDAAPIVNYFFTALFPHYRNGEKLSGRDLSELHQTVSDAISKLRGTLDPGLIEGVISRLPEVQAKLLLDAQAILEGDPAARSIDEVIIAYPGFFAIAVYRIAHEFSRAGVPILPRVLTEHAHEKTGIDIHPGATIGAGFCIDHGTGIVIGETSVVGERVKLYQGVTLGALSVKKAAADTKRHPTVEDNVVIYSNATVLGGETVLGHDSVIGGNVWITESVAPHSVIYHKSEVTLRSNKE